MIIFTIWKQKTEYKHGGGHGACVCLLQKAVLQQTWKRSRHLKFLSYVSPSPNAPRLTTAPDSLNRYKNKNEHD